MYRQRMPSLILVPVRHESVQLPVHGHDLLEVIGIAHDPTVEDHLLGSFGCERIVEALQPVVLHGRIVHRDAQQHEAIIAQFQQPLDTALRVVVGGRWPPTIHGFLGLQDKANSERES